MRLMKSVKISPAKSDSVTTLAWRNICMYELDVKIKRHSIAVTVSPFIRQQEAPDVWEVSGPEYL